VIDPIKLIKLLMLSTSDSDGEALSAIRHANQLVKKSNLTWEDVIKKGNYKKKRSLAPPPRKPDPPPKPPERPKPPPPPPPPKSEEPKKVPKVDEMFVFLMNHPELPECDYDYKFTKSVCEFYIEKKWISEKQKKYIFKIYKKYLKKTSHPTQ
jgi:hypothetical protein